MSTEGSRCLQQCAFFYIPQEIQKKALPPSQESPEFCDVSCKLLCMPHAEWECQDPLHMLFPGHPEWHRSHPCPHCCGKRAQNNTWSTSDTMPCFDKITHPSLHFPIENIFWPALPHPLLPRFFPLTPLYSAPKAQPQWIPLSPDDINPYPNTGIFDRFRLL